MDEVEPKRGAVPLHCVRVIPRLDIKGPNVVKGVHLEGLRVLGKPERFSRHYYENGADEILFVDVVASLYGRNSMHDIIRSTAREIAIPLTVAGGLRTLEDIREVLQAGADKVSLNTAAIARPELIREAARRFGSSTIVVSIEAIRQPGGNYLAYTDNGREHTGVDAFDWAVRAAELGAGEILITSVDREGTGKGFDLELTRRVASSVGIPVIACGGAGCAEHVREVMVEGEADAVALASVLHYELICMHPASRDDFASEGNVTFLRGLVGAPVRTGTSLPEIKRTLEAAGVPVRPASSRTGHA
jgi:cyclase